MDIGTAKPTLAERRGVPHHLLDLVEPDEPFSVADFIRAAEPVLADLAARGHAALPSVGRASGCGPWPVASTSMPRLPIPELRARLEDELASGGLPALAARLSFVAPQAAARTDLATRAG